jgi:hypothetical protein
MTQRSTSTSLGSPVRGVAHASAPAREAQNETSWDHAKREPSRLAASDAAHFAAVGVMALLNAERKRTVTIQWMPDDDGKGCRFEIIRVHDGAYLGIAYIDEDGRVTFNG